MKKTARFIMCLIFCVFLCINTYAQNNQIKSFYSEVIAEENKLSEEYITRGEFIAVLMKHMGYTKDIYISSFYDVYEYDWNYAYIANAEEYGIANGDSNGAFNSDISVTVEEAITFISRAFNIKPMIFDDINSATLNVSMYAKDYVDYAIINNIYPKHNQIPLNADVNIQTSYALKLIEDYINLNEDEKEQLIAVAGYPKITESGKNNSVGISVKMNKPCTIYYKITEAHQSAGALIPKKEDINTHLISVSKAEYEVNTTIEVDRERRYNIYLIARDYKGLSSRIYTLSNVMASPFTIGDGTVKNPYQIHTQYQLDQVRFYPDKAFVLCTDIDYQGKWVPIGNREEQNQMFSGVFDGNGHKITNLQISGEEGVGFISCLFGGTVKNLYLDADVIGESYVGTIAGESQGGIIKKCHVTGNVQANGNIAGGIVGKNNGEISSCVSGLYSVASASYSGGIAGINTGDIVECLSSVGYVISDMYASGIAGANTDGLIDSCVAANIEVYDLFTQNSGRITTNRNSGVTRNNYAYESMISGANVSLGINTSDGEDVSWNELTGTEFYQNKLKWNFTSVWTMDNKPSYMLPCIKKISPPQIQSGVMIYSPIIIKTESDLRKINDNLAYHYLLENDIKISKDGSKTNWTPIGLSDDDTSLDDGFSGTFDGNGHTISGIRIQLDENVSQYGLFGKITQGEVRNLTLTDVVIEGHNKVGTIAAINYGTIDNCNVYANISTQSYDKTTLTGGICAANYNNLYSSDAHVNIVVNSVASTVGGISAHNEGFIYDCAYMGNIEATSQKSTSNSILGGIVGANYSGYVYNCFSNSNIKLLSCMNYSGGIAGLINGGEIYKCSAMGNISSVSSEVLPSYTYLGGITGLISGGLVMNSFSADNLSAHADKVYSGGIAGYGENAIIQNTYSVNSINQVGAIYNKESVDAYAGGIVGYADACSINYNVSFNPYILTNGFYAPVCAYSNEGISDNNYYYIDINSPSDISEYAVVGEAESYSELTSKKFYFESVIKGGNLGWLNSLEDDVWTMSSNTKYPLPVLAGVKNQGLFKMSNLYKK